MAALAGLIGASGLSQALGEAMLSALRQWARDGSSSKTLGDAWFGCQLFHTLPEDDFDCQPYVGAGGRIMLAADARIDNRDELGMALALGGVELARISDCELLLRGWERWGSELAGRLLGDIAMAVWDRGRSELALVRTPLSTRPLFYHRRDGLTAFASLPSALFAIPSIPREPNVEQVAELLSGDIYQPRGASLFAGVEAVPQGHAIFFRNGSDRSVRLWELGQSRTTISVSEAGEAIRAELDRAVGAQLRRRGGAVASQLSGGRDSSAVATSAAIHEPGVLALTAAPRAGFPKVEDDHWIADESHIAGETARRAGISHRILRSSEAPFSGLIDSIAPVHFKPIGNPVNLPWIAHSCIEAKDCGATVMLVGNAGNFALSLGGVGFLGEYRRVKGMPDWISLAAGIRRQSGLSWTTLVAASFGSLVPRPAYAVARLAAGRDRMLGAELSLLREPVRRLADQLRCDRLGDPRPHPSRRIQFADIAMAIEPGDKFSLPLFGIDVRDPTADRRLVELIHSLPVESFVAADQARPAYAAAFGGRVPQVVVNGRQAGYQAANWFETIRPDDVREAFRRYAKHPIIEAWFDQEEIERRIDAWPRKNGERIATYEIYCNQLLGALALASFVSAQFPA